IAVRHGPRRAHRGAGAAARAQVRIHDDLLAALVAAYGFCRTDIYTGTATYGLVAAMGAQRRLVIEELGLFELAHHVAQLEQDGGVAAIPRKIALRQLMAAQLRRGAEIEHQVELLGELARRALEIDGARHRTGRHAIAVRLAQRGVDLVVKTNGV